MVTKKEFRAFVDQQRQAEAAEAEVDWNQRHDMWLKDVARLYEMVERYLSECANEGAVSLKFEEIEINEERIGLYKTKAAQRGF